MWSIQILPLRRLTSSGWKSYSTGLLRKVSNASKEENSKTVASGWFFPNSWAALHREAFHVRNFSFMMTSKSERTIKTEASVCTTEFLLMFLSCGCSMDCGQIYEEEVSCSCIIEIPLSIQKILDKTLNSFLGSICADMSFNVKYRGESWYIPIVYPDPSHCQSSHSCYIIGIIIIRKAHQRAFQLPSRPPNLASYQHPAKTGVGFGFGHQALFLLLWHSRVPVGENWPMQPVLLYRQLDILERQPVRNGWVEIFERWITITSCVARSITRLWAILGDKMANPVWPLRFIPSYPREWNPKRFISIWYHFGLEVIYGTVRIPTEAGKILGC